MHSPQATREVGSSLTHASRTASETWSQILSVSNEGNCGTFCQLKIFLYLQLSTRTYRGDPR
jgi:hypothetical protein